MHSIKPWLLGIISGTVASVSLLAPAALAAQSSGEVTRSTEGGRATCVTSSGDLDIHDRVGTISCDLTDTLADNHGVYIDWRQDSFAKVRLPNDQGAGRTVHVVDSRRNGQGSFGELRWRVCRDRQLARDNCSAWYVLDLP